ncbi:hypothetical protein SAMN05444161_6762 [Rhizobiales bacterium GAS191]|nr:hypothetical protein SAMN05519103_05878 [Rhizobiales bacterium GAS113]SEE70062.1 hypothetical protein SAMN05444161_6762 [Rhizobiales bacterium GAS191]
MHAIKVMIPALAVAVSLTVGVDKSIAGVPTAASAASFVATATESSRWIRSCGEADGDGADQAGAGAAPDGHGAPDMGGAAPLMDRADPMDGADPMRGAGPMDGRTRLLGWRL